MSTILAKLLEVSENRSIATNKKWNACNFIGVCNALHYIIHRYLNR